MSDHLEPDWLPEGVRQLTPSHSFSPPPKGGEDKDRDPLVGLRWSSEFWNETEDEARGLIREGVLIAKQINNFTGHFEHGKTTIVGDLAYKWATNHGPVLYLDWEMGSRRVRKRMKAHGWTEDLMREHWYYSYAPQLPPGKLAAVADLLGPNLLIVIDSFSAAMMSLGLSENDATEVGKWWGAELQPLGERSSATVAVISQVKQSASSSSTYTQRGTGATSFGSDVIWFVERFRKFTPTEAGEVRLTRKKDREGVLPERLGFALGGDGEDRIALRPIDPPKGEPADENLLELVTALLEGPESEARGGLATSAICKGIEGYGEAKVKTALEQLERDLRVEHFMNTGTGGGVKWRLPSTVVVPNAPPLN